MSDQTRKPGIVSDSRERAARELHQVIMDMCDAILYKDAQRLVEFAKRLGEIKPEVGAMVAQLKEPRCSQERRTSCCVGCSSVEGCDGTDDFCVCHEGIDRATLLREAESKIEELTRHRDQWEQSYKEYRGINDEVQAKLRVELKQAREALRRAVGWLSEVRAQGHEDHALWNDIANFVDEFEALSRKGNKDV